MPGRVVGQNRDSLRAATATGVADVVIQRGFRRTADLTGEFPTVGDWLALEPTGDDGQYLLREILPRSTAFIRGESFGGSQLRAQVLAANIDSVLIVAALTGDFNVRRIERYLSLAWASRAQPVIVLNKADLCDELDERLADVYAVCGDVPVHAVSATTGGGVPHLLRYLTSGATVVLLGSSGVGKSTLTNALLGHDRQLVSAVREDDDRGRHTTTGRELFALPSGALADRHAGPSLGRAVGCRGRRLDGLRGRRGDRAPMPLSGLPSRGRARLRGACRARGWHARPGATGEPAEARTRAAFDRDARDARRTAGSRSRLRPDGEGTRKDGSLEEWRLRLMARIR